ncbi:YqeG family HAD IIIA-type phosphatase [Vampirovibrio chlorellavorus]|uniref:YqeG family HAD IIIA-type phosphatase n=1 Tax=Vampirovibrio chlorellavorus TaxID=758823 RepID=UPI0026EFAD7B|nr:YqeG family HAD IIIA-type phosphatase [Vampirovibrio chlorellavorus]
MFLKPSLIVQDITTIDLALLKANGIKGFIFDLDNTIMAPHTGALEQRIESWLVLLQAEGFKCLVLSNNKKADYCQLAEKVLNIPVISHAAKPRRSQFRKALQMIGLSAREVAMVGDRPLTDIWVGQRMGAFTILVDPLIKHQERRLYKVLRGLERLFVKGG